MKSEPSERLDGKKLDMGDELVWNFFEIMNRENSTTPILKQVIRIADSGAGSQHTQETVILYSDYEAYLLKRMLGAWVKETKNEPT